MEIDGRPWVSLEIKTASAVVLISSLALSLFAAAVGLLSPFSPETRWPERRVMAPPWRPSLVHTWGQSRARCRRAAPWWCSLRPHTRSSLNPRSLSPLSALKAADAGEEGQRRRGSPHRSAHSPVGERAAVKRSCDGALGRGSRAWRRAWLGCFFPRVVVATAARNRVGPPFLHPSI